MKTVMVYTFFIVFLILNTFQSPKDDLFINAPPSGDVVVDLEESRIYLHDSYWMYIYSTRLIKESLHLVEKDLNNAGVNVKKLSPIKIRFKNHPGILVRENEVDPISATIDVRGFITIYPRYTSSSISLPAAYRTFIHEMGHLVFKRLFGSDDHPGIKAYQAWRMIDSTDLIWDRNLHEIFAEDFKSAFTPDKRMAEFGQRYPKMDVPLLFQDFTAISPLDNDQKEKFREMIRREYQTMKPFVPPIPSFPPHSLKSILTSFVH